MHLTSVVPNYANLVYLYPPANQHVSIPGTADQPAESRASLLSQLHLLIVLTVLILGEIKKILAAILLS